MPRKPVPKIGVVITVDESHRSRLSEVLDRLKSAGLQSPQTLVSLGLITGQVAPDALPRLQAVVGVMAVEASGKVQIAPPDAEVQ